MPMFPAFALMAAYRPQAKGGEKRRLRGRRQLSPLRHPLHLLLLTLHRQYRPPPRPPSPPLLQPATNLPTGEAVVAGAREALAAADQHDRQVPDLGSSLRYPAALQEVLEWLAFSLDEIEDSLHPMGSGVKQSLRQATLSPQRSTCGECRRRSAFYTI